MSATFPVSYSEVLFNMLENVKNAHSHGDPFCSNIIICNSKRCPFKGSLGVSGDWQVLAFRVSRFCLFFWVVLLGGLNCGPPFVEATTSSLNLTHT